MAKHRKPEGPHLPKTHQPQAIQAPRRPEANEQVTETDSATLQWTPTDLEALRRLQKLRGSRVLLLVCAENVVMRDDVPYHAYKLLREMGKSPRIDILLHSRGGATEVPAKLIPLIRNYCEHLGVIVPYRAHSAATHIALGANEIVMGPMSELSPVDPSRVHPLLPKDKDGNPIPISVQDLRHVVELLKREGPDTSYTPEALATIFSAMFQYVHPLAMGAIEQSYALSLLISQKLLATHMDPIAEKDKIARIARALSDEFKSHQYQIGWREAEQLGLNVTYDEGEVYDLAWNLYEAVAKHQETPQPVPGNPARATRPIVTMATEHSKRVLFEIYELAQTGTPTSYRPIGAVWRSSHELDTKLGQVSS